MEKMINQRKTGVVLSYAGELVKILVSLIYTPIMLRLLGQSEYGLYQLVYSVVSYLSLLSLGFGSSYLRFYSRYKAQKDEDGVAKLNGMFMLIFCSISIICVLCGLVMIGNIRGIFGTGLTESEYATAKVLMGLLIINLAMTFPNSVFNCSITAHEKFLFQKLLILLQNLFSPFLTLPLLIMGYGSIGMVSVTTFLTFLLLISNMFYCFKKLHIRFAFRGLQVGLLKEMWVFTFFIFLNQIIDQINWSVDKFLLGRFAGTTAVAVYGVGGQINTLYLQFSSSVSNVFVPKVNRIVAETNAYIYTLPSDLEGMPLSLLEAMSYGKMDSNPLFATKTVAMPNFIDKVEWKETPKKDYVLYFGRFSEEKGIGTLIKVCKELPDVQFFFAGTGPLEETVNGIKNIKNVGFQKGEALEKLIREARFSIYPSEWYENCPFSVMESLWMTVRFDFELCRFSFYLKL